MFIINFNKHADLFVKRHLWKMYSRNICNTQCINPYTNKDETILRAKLLNV